jgi:hypothetical protein
MEKIEDCYGVLSATPHTIAFASGAELHKGEEVKLPKVAGGGTGTVDGITMIVDGDDLSFAVRVVDGNGKGHQFVYKEAK